jgi:alpha-beta hydrolase superfamily lysophospholipase
MQNREFNLVTSDGTFLIGRYWKPDTAPQAVVCLVHGLGEHSGRYDNWARRFTEHGIMVYSVDLRGHGLSEGRRGHISRLSDFMDDIGTLVKRAKHNRDELPLFLYGHSMGGNLVLNFLLRKRQDFSGAVVTSPWLKLKHPPSEIILRTATWAVHFMPAVRFNTGIKSSQLTCVEETQIESDSDPLMHHKISLRLFYELSRGADEVLYKAAHLTIPVFLAHGTDDEITDARTTQQLAEKIGGNATFYNVKGARHEIHNEPGSNELFFRILSWMEKSLKYLEHAV